ncbi:hypothetical protein FA15DRAFT_721216 [Coprinopsis marcescibilis]|uniref:Fungal-type protein kinase domain-containing protein n=1 Tax=Coprinopsis marcescibilis TaxID=230819 RepID=A0A5C3KJK1_COPMA|nr:hypothetical protein FA15DRAFT_721216 [Coprinopsis marcescibilis]
MSASSVKHTVGSISRPNGTVAVVNPILEAESKDLEAEGQLKAKASAPASILKLGPTASMFYTSPKVKPDSIEKAVAVKISWQPKKKRVPESIIIKTLLEKLESRWHDHLPEVYFFAHYSAEDLNIPWARIPDFPGRIGHYLAYKKGRVLHRDLSENNSLFWRKPKDSGEGSEIKGVLNDWDMASLLSDEPKSSEKHCTGTIPFMASDLLNKIGLPSPHFLRHDLESFLYILMWAIDNYDLKAHNENERHGQPKNKALLSDGPNENFGKQFLAPPKADKKSKRNPKLSALEKLKVRLVKPLLKLFKKALLKKANQEDSNSSETEDASEDDFEDDSDDEDDESSSESDGGNADSDCGKEVESCTSKDESTGNSSGEGGDSVAKAPTFDLETLGGSLTFETFMAAINEPIDPELLAD